MRKLFHFFAPVLMLTMLLVGACSGVSVEEDQTNGSKVDAALVEFTGVIESIDGNQWVINGQTLTIDPAVIRDGPFNVGDTVKVEAEVAADGSVTVTRVETPSAEDISSDANENDDNSNDTNSNDSNSNDANSNDANSNDDNSNDDNSNDDNSNDNSSLDDDDDNDNGDDRSGSGGGGGDDDDDGGGSGSDDDDD